MNNPLEPGAEVTLYLRDSESDVPTDDTVTIVEVHAAGVTVYRDYGVARYFQFYPWHMVEAITIEEKR